MKIGIISDIHDNLDSLDEAIRLFNRKVVSLVINAGDTISPFAAARFRALDSRVKAVYGNNDGERNGLKVKFGELGAEIDDFLDFEFGGKRFAVYHGTIEGMLNALLGEGSFDVVVSGHTHIPKVEKHLGTLSINSGEACGYLSSKRTICVLDTETMKTDMIEY
jgi:putative phosphoesterase